MGTNYFEITMRKVILFLTLALLLSALAMAKSDTDALLPKEGYLISLLLLT
jgi:hypothetical protein